MIRPEQNPAILNTWLKRILCNSFFTFSPVSLKFLAIFFIWAIVVGVITVLIFFTTISVLSSVCRAFGSPDLFRWIDLVQYRLVNVCQYARLPHVVCICPLSPTLSGRSYMTVSMFGSQMWELYLSFESYVVWTFLLHHSSYDLYPWYGTLLELGTWVHYWASCSLRYALVYPHSFVHLSC